MRYFDLILAEMTDAWNNVFFKDSSCTSTFEEEELAVIKQNITISTGWYTPFLSPLRKVCYTGDIFTEDNKTLISADALVSPANSFGFMDGGIDMVYWYITQYRANLIWCVSERFGWQILERLQKLIQDEHFGEIPVGSAAIIDANDPKGTIKYLVSDHLAAPSNYL